MKDIRPYLPLYYGCKCRCYSHSDKDGWEAAICPELLAEVEDEDSEVKGVKLILRPLSSMTEENFRGIASRFFNTEKLVFDYACDRELDPEFEGEVIEHINEACDDDPENVIMCESRSKSITHGWISYEEVYHGFSTVEQAEIFKILLSLGFDLFGLIEEGLAIDATTLKQKV